MKNFALSILSVFALTLSVSCSDDPDAFNTALATLGVHQAELETALGRDLPQEALDYLNGLPSATDTDVGAASRGLETLSADGWTYKMAYIIYDVGEVNFDSLLLVGFRGVEAIVWTSGVAAYIPDITAAEPEIYVGYGGSSSSGFIGPWDSGAEVISDDCNVFPTGGGGAARGTGGSGEWVSPEYEFALVFDNLALYTPAPDASRVVIEGDYELYIPEDEGYVGPVALTGFYEVDSCTYFGD